MPHPEKPHVSQSIELPPVVIHVPGDGAATLVPSAPACMMRCVLCPQLFAKSELFVVQLRWLKQTANLLPPLHIGSLGVAFLALLLHLEQFSIVASKLFERDEEVA